MHTRRRPGLLSLAVAPCLALCLVGGLGGLLAGCPTKEDRIADARRERRVQLDSLYDQYGGGTVAGDVQRGMEPEDPARGQPAALEMLKNAVSEVDRASFETQCEQLGAGERPVLLTDKARAFFARADVERRCQKVRRLSDRIAELTAPAPPAQPTR
jgi:hypothetical protein